MDKTKLGKYLVFINLALSIIFLGWAIGVYTQRMPWGPVTLDGEQVKGRVAELGDQIRQLEAARDSADARWYAATSRLINVESERPKRNDYYNEQIKIITVGKDLRDQPIGPAVQQLALPDFKDGKLVTRKSGRPPVQIDGKNALSVAGYNQEIEKKLKEIQGDQNKIKELVGQAEQLTLEINGEKPRDQAITAKDKGLRGQLDDQVWLKRAAQLEEQFLLTPLTNFQVETELLKKRQTALQARLKELTSASGE